MGVLRLRSDDMRIGITHPNRSLPPEEAIYLVSHNPAPGGNRSAEDISLVKRGDDMQMIGHDAPFVKKVVLPVAIFHRLRQPVRHLRVTQKTFAMTGRQEFLNMGIVGALQQLALIIRQLPFLDMNHMLKFLTNPLPFHPLGDRNGIRQMKGDMIDGLVHTPSRQKITLCRDKRRGGNPFPWKKSISCGNTISKTRRIKG